MSPGISRAAHAFGMNSSETVDWIPGPRSSYPALVTMATLIAIAVVTGVLGNSVVIAVYRRKSALSSSQVFMLTLAYCDLLAALFLMPTAPVYMFGHYNAEMFLVWSLVLHIVFIYNIVTLVAVAVDRYFAICRPLLFAINARRAQRICAFNMLITILITGLFMTLQYAAALWYIIIGPPILLAGLTVISVCYIRIYTVVRRRGAVRPGRQAFAPSPRETTSSCSPRTRHGQGDRASAGVQKDAHLKEEEIKPIDYILEDIDSLMTGIDDVEPTSGKIVKEDHVAGCKQCTTYSDKCGTGVSTVAQSYDRKLPACVPGTCTAVRCCSQEPDTHNSSDNALSPDDTSGKNPRTVHHSRTQHDVNQGMNVSTLSSGVPISYEAHGSKSGKVHQKSPRPRCRTSSVRKAQMLATVTLVFVVGYIPYFGHRVAPHIIDEPFSFLYFVNNAANPIIYSFFNPQFRKDAREVLNRWRRLGSRG